MSSHSSGARRSLGSRAVCDRRRARRDRSRAGARPARRGGGSRSHGSERCRSSLYAALFLLLPAGDVLIGAFRNDQDMDDGQRPRSVSRRVPARVRELDPHQHLHGARRRVDRGARCATRRCIPRRRAGSARSSPRSLPSRRSSAACPLAFFFISSIGTLGRRDAVPQGLPRPRHLRAQHHGLRLLGRLPLLCLLSDPAHAARAPPAIDGLKPEWREASESLGGESLTYWRSVGIPVLAPPSSERLVLLFGNAFAAQATAYALTSGGYNIVPLEITNVLNGNVVSDPHFGQALALGMIVVIAVAVLIYLPLQRRAATVDEVKRRMPHLRDAGARPRRALLHRADRRHRQVQRGAGASGLRLRRPTARSSTTRRSGTRCGSRSSSRSRRPP